MKWNPGGLVTNSSEENHISLALRNIKTEHLLNNALHNINNENENPSNYNVFQSNIDNQQQYFTNYLQQLNDRKSRIL